MADSVTKLLAEFIDATVSEPSKARTLLEGSPELRNMRYLHGETALHFLAIESYLDGVRFLVELGFDVNATNRFGDPPLIDVVRLQNLAMAEVLLAAGADANFESSTYGTPIECAEFSKDLPMKDLLIRFGAKQSGAV